jgi:hypothetical protein
MSRPVSPDYIIPRLATSGVQTRDYPLLSAFVRIWAECQDAFIQARTHRLCLSVALGHLTAFGRRTISRGICARAKQFQDWTHVYRFFSMDKWSPLALQHKTLCHVATYLEPDAPLVVALDDTAKRRVGKHIPTASYFYDPKSPPFARSYAWAVRFISISVMLHSYGVCGPARGIPIRFDLAPTVPKPRRNATPEQKAEYLKTTRNWSLSTMGVEQIALLRAEMDGEPELAPRLLVVTADNSYCNSRVLQSLPERTALIARTRKDLKLFGPPPPSPPGTKGRPKQYGDQLPTPEQIRQDDQNYPWQTTLVYATGKWHSLRYKTVAPVYSRCAGPRPLRLIIIAPLGYRLRLGGRMLYREPAYLLVSDPDYPVHAALQHYFHRWEIEVNHRDEKDALGMGQAQVWNHLSLARQPPFCAMLYSWLLLASLDAYGPGRGSEYLPRPKWRSDPPVRPSALDLVAQLRRELWAYEPGLPMNWFSPVSSQQAKPGKYAQEAERWLADTVPKGLSASMTSSMLYANA